MLSSGWVPAPPTAGGPGGGGLPASPAPVGGLAQGPSTPRALAQGLRFFNPLQQEPGSPGQWAPRPLGPGASSTKRPAPAQWRGRRSPRAGQGRPS